MCTRAPVPIKEVLMTGMNGKRILAGGLVAGVVMTALEMAAEPLFGLDWEGWLAGLGVPAPGDAAAAYVVVGGLMLGIVAMWLYASIRPRYGPGPRTALMVALVIWALACLFPTVGLAAFGVLPVNDLFWVSVLFPLVQLPAATLAGARMYREVEGEGAGVAAAAAGW
jgi:hypothetical protein